MKAPRRKRTNGQAGQPTSVVRCAIYTRKSTSEGLDRDFNTLDAQRESAEDFIRSQRSQGWIALPDRYDDGGFTGANTERPALKRLLGDIEAGKIDAAVVNKLDRLSRSLHDFGQMMRFFEKHGVTFVSVTQQFNTSTSMGRFTLNILSSFAEFERDMISERTRDKLHAARRRGKFTGGTLPLGYDRDPQGGRLVVNASEAERVREIFCLFLENPALVATAEELTRRAWTLKAWTTKDGKLYGGGQFDKFNLRRFLQNPVYVGKVLLKGTLYDGEHEAIIDDVTWMRVQEVFESRKIGPRRRSTKSPAPLAGHLFCLPCERPMTPTYSQKGRYHYRYYVCSRAHREGWAKCPTKHVPARQIEAFVVDQIRAIGRDPELIARTVEAARGALATRKADLASETKRLRKDLNEAHRAVRGALRPVGGNGRYGNGRRAADDCAEAIQDLEAQLEAVQAEQEALRGRGIRARDLKAALGAFDPVWGQMTPAEQGQVVDLLIERVDYDGGEESLEITFSPAGIRLALQRGSEVARGAGA